MSISYNELSTSYNELASLPRSILSQVPALPAPSGIEPSLVNPYNRGPRLVIPMSILLALALAFYTIRMYSKSLTTRKFFWDDCKQLIYYGTSISTEYSMADYRYSNSYFELRVLLFSFQRLCFSDWTQSLFANSLSISPCMQHSSGVSYFSQLSHPPTSPNMRPRLDRRTSWKACLGRFG